METIVNWLVQEIGQGSVINAVAVVVMVLVMVIAAWAIKHFALNEKVARYQKALALLDEIINDAIMFVGSHDVVDFEAAELEAAEMAQQEPPYIIDPRMLYVVRETQRYAESQLGLKLDFVFVHRKAERLFQWLKESTKNTSIKF